MYSAVVFRARIVAALTAGAAAVPVVAADARTAQTTPSAAQIRAAVRAAEHSRSLWATVNICDTPNHPDTVGVRGQMPSLGFPADLSIDIQLDYWSFSANKFMLDPGVSKSVSLGSASSSIVQGGANFRFKPPVVLSGTVTFEWKRGGKVIGRATRLTGHGYKHVDGGDPRGYSTATCRMS
jgi:hypothetical protein